MREGSDGTAEAIFFRGHTKIVTVALSEVVRGLSKFDNI